MAVNPLYQNPYYFFSNMYDDSLITNFYRTMVAETYERSVQYQQDIIGRARYLEYQSDGSSILQDFVYQSTIGELIIDNKRNLSLGLPLNSRTVLFGRLVIPVYNQKRYLRKYGQTTKRIPLMDFIQETAIFDKYFTLYFGKYRIFRAELIQLGNGTVVLAIPNVSNTGILESTLDAIISEYSPNEPIRLFTEPHTSVYGSNVSTSTVVSSVATNGYYQITMNKSSALSTVNSMVGVNISNSWDCFMSINSNNYGRGILTSCPCTLLAETDSTIAFVVDARYIDSIRRNGISIYAMFIHRPNRHNISIYTRDLDSVPVMSLPYDYNPSSRLTVEICKFDNDSYSYLERLYSKESLTQVYFPNIYNLESIVSIGDTVIINTTEYSPFATNQYMANRISQLIDSCGERYSEIVHNNYLPNLNLQTYHPLANNISVDDYTSSEYYGNIRGYLLDKIHNLMESDPGIMDDYYTWMRGIINNVITYSGTPKIFKFGGNPRGEEFTGTNSVVMDTSHTSVNVDETYYFTEPHSYISISGSLNSNPAVNLYICGKYVRPSAKVAYRGNVYLYYPVSKMNSAMEIFSSSDECKLASPITIDIFVSSVDGLINTVEDGFTIQNTSSNISIFKNLVSQVHSLHNLVFRDVLSGKIITDILSYFDIALNVSEYIIESNGVADKVLLEKGKTIEYLLTVLEEIYATMDKVPIILNETTVALSLNDFIDELNISGGDYSISDFNKKVLDFNNVTFLARSSTSVGANISVISNKYKAEYITYGKDAILDNGKYNITFNNSYYDNDLSHYILFYNGVLDSYQNIEVSGDSYGSDIVCTISGEVNDSDEFILVHLPIPVANYDGSRLSISDDNKMAIIGYMNMAEAEGDTQEELWPAEESYNAVFIYHPVDKPELNVNTNMNSFNSMTFLNGLRLKPPSNITGYNNHAFYTGSEMKYVNTEEYNVQGLKEICDVPFVSPAINDLNILYKFYSEYPNSNYYGE